MTDNRLKSFADRLDALEEERKGIVGDIKDVFTEVSSAGYNAKALRKVLADRRKKTDAELEADVELYRAALAEPGATYRSVAAKVGVPKSTLQRRVPRERNGTSPSPDPDGEITETGESCGGVESRHAGQGAGRPEGLGVQPVAKGAGASVSGAQAQERGASAESHMAAPVHSTDLSDPAGVAPGPHDTTTITKAVTACIDGNECLDVRCNLEGCRLKATQFEAPAAPSVGAVASESERVAPHIDDDSALAAMEEAGQRLRQMRAERGL